MYINGKNYPDVEKSKELIEIWTHWRDLTPALADKLFYKLMKKQDDLEAFIKRTGRVTSKQEKELFYIEDARLEIQSIGYALRGQLKTLFVKLAQSLSDTGEPDFASATPMFIRYVKVFVPAQA